MSWLLKAAFVVCATGVLAGPPLPPGSPVRSPRDSERTAVMAAAVIVVPPATNNLYALTLSGSGFALTFRTNVPSCTVLCGTNVGRWVAARRLTNAVAGRAELIGCPWTNQPQPIYFKVTLP